MAPNRSAPMLLALSICLLTSVVAAETPALPTANPWAAQGPYPMSHHNPGQTDLTIVNGPTRGKKLERKDVKTVPVVWCSAPIVKKVGGHTTVIAGTPHGLVKIDATGEAFDAVSFMPYPGIEQAHLDVGPDEIDGHRARIDERRRRKQDWRLLFEAAYMLWGLELNMSNAGSGAYGVIDKEGYYYTFYDSTRLVKAFDGNLIDAPLEPVSHVEVTDGLPAEQAEGIDRILGLSMTYDGHLVVAAAGAALVLDDFLGRERGGRESAGHAHPRRPGRADQDDQGPELEAGAMVDGEFGAGWSGGHGANNGAIRWSTVADWGVTDTATSTGASRLGLPAAAFAILFWSSGNIMVRKVPMPGLQIAFWRILLAAVVYTVVVYLSGRRLTWDHVRRTIPTGVTIALEIAVFFVAIKSTTVANATVIGSLVPLLLMGVASRHFGERVTGFLVGAAVVSLGGVVLVMFGSSSEATWSLRGDLLAVVALVFFAAYFALAKAARQHVPALEFQAAIWVVGAIVLLPVAVVDAGGVDWPSIGNWWWLVALLLVPGTGHLLMNWAHPHVKLTLTSMLTLAVPVITTIGGAVFLDEPVDVLQVAGIAIVLAALAEVIRREAQIEGAEGID